MSRRLFIVLLLTLGVSLPAFAAPGDWEMLGRRTVNMGVDRDEIVVGRRDGRFSRIKLVVRGFGIHLLDMKVVFGNGSVFDVPVNRFIPANGETRVIDLPGQRRVIRKVVLVYRSAVPARRAWRPWRRRVVDQPDVLVFGRH
ncbi:MAG: hypothetical protein LJE84_01800 [Gammaproteobacteria bacterium]|jgi:hypothetical protein|nr:hypothetical protein [Gammaproteobacteria bacterium]